MVIHLQRALVLVAAAISVVMLLPPISPLFSRWSFSMPFSGSGAAEQPGVIVSEPVKAALPFPDEETDPEEPQERPSPTKAKGLVASGYTAGGSRFDDLIDMIERTELNAVVIDIKDEAGEISWVPETPRLRLAGAGRPKIDDPEEVIGELRDRDIYVIGRIVSHQDPILAEARPDLAVQDTHGGIWRNRHDLGWVDPYSPEVRTYLFDLAKEAVSLGFDEIQFDYIRFPSDGDISRIWYPHQDLRTREQVIKGFFEEAREELVPMGAYISADLFGFVTIANDDQGIGQRIHQIAEEVDYLSLMIYPSHYTPGNYGLDDPESSPYELIRQSLIDAQERIEGTRAKLRPWLQDFSLRVRYGPAEVRAQIRAAEELGVDEWLLWNAGNYYTEEALRSD